MNLPESEQQGKLSLVGNGWKAVLMPKLIILPGGKTREDLEQAVRGLERRSNCPGKFAFLPTSVHFS